MSYEKIAEKYGEHDVIYVNWVWNMGSRGIHDGEFLPIAFIRKESDVTPEDLESSLHRETRYVDYETLTGDFVALLVGEIVDQLHLEGRAYIIFPLQTDPEFRDRITKSEIQVYPASDLEGWGKGSAFAQKITICRLIQILVHVSIDYADAVRYGLVES